MLGDGLRVQETGCEEEKGDENKGEQRIGET